MNTASQPNREAQPVGTRDVLLAGADYQDPYTDLQWSRRQPNGNWAIRITGFVMRKAFRKGCSRISFDYPSFEQAMQQVKPGQLVVLAPSHRSFMDFIVCSYLCFSHPELRISIPYIAADLQIGGLPFLGWFLKQTYAFYLKRGRGKADPELNQKILQLVKAEQTLEIFIEGTRSRSRQCLKPKRGLLRALQNTEVPCALLPITINYDRLPEENAILKEVRGASKPLLGMRPLLNWCTELFKGQVQIGHVHMMCGDVVHLDKDSDVHEVSMAVMGQIQDCHVASHYHLKAFLLQNPDLEIKLENLIAALEVRGGKVIESDLDASHTEAICEHTYRNQWVHHFFPEMQRHLEMHPVLQHYIQSHLFSQRQVTEIPLNHKAPIPEVGHLSMASLTALLTALVHPLARAHNRVIAEIEAQGHFKHRCARAFVGAHTDCFLDMVETVFEYLTQAEIVALDPEQGLIPGPQWHHRAPFEIQVKQNAQELTGVSAQG